MWELRVTPSDAPIVQFRQVSLWLGQSHTVSQAYFALHKTSNKFKVFREKIFFGTNITFEAFLSIS